MIPAIDVHEVPDASVYTNCSDPDIPPTAITE
jgi:hypothetical protein